MSDEDDGTAGTDPDQRPDERVHTADAASVEVPETDGPEVEVPEVEAPTVRDPSEDLPDPSSVDPDVSRPFAVAVGYANVALFGVSLGLMLIGFRGEWRWGGTAVAVGVFAAVRVYQTYRAFERDRTDAEGTGTDAP